MVMAILRETMNNYELPHGMTNNVTDVSSETRLEWCENYLLIPDTAEGGQPHLQQYELIGLQFCTHP
jgi:hypothetical protein